MADLNDCSARWQDPISTDYGDYTVYEAPPNSSGHILLQELNVIRQHDLASLGFGSAASIHLMVEAKKMAFADREAYVADPDYIDVPVAGMLSAEYARERAATIDPERASENVSAGDPWPHQPAGQRRSPAGVGRAAAWPARRTGRHHLFSWWRTGPATRCASCRASRAAGVPRWWPAIPASCSTTA